MPADEPRRGPRPIDAAAAGRDVREAASRITRPADGSELPVWMLDIDGVLNAFGALDRRPFMTGVANGYEITWDPTLTDRVHRLHVDGRVEVRWLTTWGALANTYIAPLLGWSELLVAGEPAHGLEWWKLRHAAAVVDAESRRLVWTDDDLGTSTHADAWLRRQGPGQVLAIRTEPATGLTHADLDRIERWLRPDG